MCSLWPQILLLWFLRFPYVFIVADALMAFKSLSCAYLDFDVLLVKIVQIYSLNSIPQVPQQFVLWAHHKLSEFPDGYHHLSFALCVCVLVNQSCLTICNPMHCSLPRLSVYGIS